MLRWLPHAALILVLTLLTQVGGLIYAATLWGRRFVPFARTRFGFATLFVIAYAIAWLPIEKLALLAGRGALPCIENSAAPLSGSPFSCVLHRHYAKRELVIVAADLARAADDRFPGTLTRTLDGGFPFFDGFPLPPHISHDDGEKLDLSFYYATDGRYRPGAMASPIGYWAFAAPRAGEPRPCESVRGGLRWDMAWFAPFTRRDLELERERTRFALRWLAINGPRRGVGKVFVEPHLAQRLRVQGAVIRFQGCRAARHDDHIHIQLR